METLTQIKLSSSFNKGWMELAQKHKEAARTDIMETLGITSKTAWLRRLRGTVTPTIIEAAKVEAVFKKYGIKKPWGDG